MAINATNNSKQRELIPSGNYIARCYQMIEIGTITETILGTEKTLHKVRIGWELPTETKVFDDAKGEQPLVISKEYTLSMNEKSNLRKDLKSWRGKDFTDEEAKKFDITNLLGVSCMLNVIHVTSKDGSKQYASISGITPLPKGIDCPPQVNKSICLSFDNFDNALFNSMPDFIKEKIVSSVEYKAMQRPQEVEVVEDETINTDDVPF